MGRSPKLTTTITADIDPRTHAVIFGSLDRITFEVKGRTTEEGATADKLEVVLPSEVMCSFHQTEKDGTQGLVVRLCHAGSEAQRRQRRRGGVTNINNGDMGPLSSLVQVDTIHGGVDTIHGGLEMRTVRSRQFRVKAQPAAPTPEPADDMTDSNWRGADVIIRVFQRPDSKLMLIDPTNF